MDQAARLGALIEARREELQLSVARAARLADVSRGTWIGIEKAERETESYNFVAVEQTLGWRQGSIKRALAGGQVEQLEAPEHAAALRAILARGRHRPADRDWVERLIRALVPDEADEPTTEPGGRGYWDTELGEITDPDEQRIWDRRRSVEWRRGMIYLMRDELAQGGSGEQRAAS